MAVDIIYAGILFLAAIAPWAAYKARDLGEAIIWGAIGTASSWALLTWAGSMQYAVLFYLGGGLFLANMLELALAVFSPLIRGSEEE